MAYRLNGIVQLINLNYESAKFTYVQLVVYIPIFNQEFRSMLISKLFYRIGMLNLFYLDIFFNTKTCCKYKC